IECADIDEEKKRAAIEFATAVTGQYLNALAHTKTSSADNLNSYNILQDAKKTAVGERNNALVHEVLNFNKAKFAAGLNDNVLPAYRSFQALNTINTYSVSSHKGVEVAFSLADSFITLKSYTQAVEHYKNCLDYLDNSERFFKITEDAVIEIDVGKIKSGIDLYELLATKMLTLCYISNYEPKKAIACFEKMFEKIVNMSAMAEAFENFINTLNIKDGDPFDYLVNKITNDGGEEFSIYMSRDSYAKRVISIFFDVVSLLRINKNYRVSYIDESDLRSNIAELLDSVSHAYLLLKQHHKILEICNYALSFVDEEHKGKLLLQIKKASQEVSFALQQENYKVNISDASPLKTTTNHRIWKLLEKNIIDQNDKQIVVRNTTALDVFNSNKRLLKERFGEGVNDIELLCYTDAVDEIDKKQDAATIVQQLVDLENNANKTKSHNFQKVEFYLKICRFLDDIAHDNVELNKIDEVFILLNTVEYYLERAYHILDPVLQGDEFELRLELLIHFYCKDEVFSFDKLNTIAIKLLGFLKKYNANSNLVWFYLGRKYSLIAKEYFREKDANQVNKYCNLSLDCMSKISTQHFVFTNLKGGHFVSDSAKHTYFFIDYLCHSQLGARAYKNLMDVNKASIHFKQAMHSINRALDLDPQNADYQKERKDFIEFQSAISQQVKQSMKQPIRGNRKK
ncbi:MAG: hypothetical protein K0R24_2114, partial [Gammaproteobacteria bacterium]|nr:hypothetical protein [Gammaproteobacteria bacterium]